jgi:hypothetical protein
MWIETVDKESEMIYDLRTALSMTKEKGTKRSTELFGARGMQITRASKPQSLTTRLSLIDRVKKQLSHGFKKAEIDLIRPRSYEIQIFPAYTPKTHSHNSQQERIS